MRSARTFLLALIPLLALTGFAQQPPMAVKPAVPLTPSTRPATAPASRAPAILDNDGKPVAGVSVATADVHAIVRGPLAEATVTLTFRNDQDRVLGGELTFPLPDGATVSGYGLDVGGVMVDGVAVEKQQARVIYETEMNKVVDPGLVEHVVGNNFRTRLYPIPAKGTRTVKVSYVLDLLPSTDGKGATLSLPLGLTPKVAGTLRVPSAADAVGVPAVPEGRVAGLADGTRSVPATLANALEKFDLTIAVEGATESPTVRGGTYANKPFQQVDRGFYLKESLKDAQALDTLTITLPEIPASSTTIERGTATPAFVNELPEPGDLARSHTHFVLTDTPTAPAAAPLAMRNQRLLLVWDASLSRRNADLKREIAVLEKALAALGHPSLDIVFVRNELEFKPFFGTGEKESARAVETIKSAIYDGATNLGLLSFPKNLSGFDAVAIGQAQLDYDLALLFTDGIGNLGEEKLKGAQIPVWAISNDVAANHNLLRSFCQESGGAYLNLIRHSDERAVAAIGRPTFSIIGIEADPKQVADVMPGVGTAIAGRVTVTGRLLGKSAGVTLIYGHGKTETSRRTFTLDAATAAEGNLVARYWAQQKVNQLTLTGGAGREEMLAVGKQYNLVTPATSLLVLETVEQYVQHGVVPPKNRPEIYKAFTEQIESRKVAAAKTKEEKIAQVLAKWNARVAWWEKEFDYPPNFRYGPRLRTGADVPPAVPVEISAEDRRRATELVAKGKRLRDEGKLLESLEAYEDARNADWGNEAAHVGRATVHKAIGGSEAELNRVRGVVKLRVDAANAQLEAARVQFAKALAKEEFRLAELAWRDMRLLLNDHYDELSRPQALAADAELSIYDDQLQTKLWSAIRLAEREGRTADADRLRPDIQLNTQRSPTSRPSVTRRYDVRDLVTDGPDFANAPDFNLQTQDSGGGPLAVTGRIVGHGGGPRNRDTGARIQIHGWDPKTPYIAAMKAVAADKAYGVFLAQREQYAASPAFYFDCAEYLLSIGQRAHGIRVLSDVLELKLDDARLIRIVAHRLQQLDELDLAIGLFEKVTRLRGEEPQSFRDLALAHAARADKAVALMRAGTPALPASPGHAATDYARALELLNKVVTGNWARFEDIELIALMEANRIATAIAAIPNLGSVSNPVDPRLRKNLDCDVRIVLTWDTDATDIDLWVTEPSGEKCLYNHNRTTIGGAMSRDFTQGYGPEEYFLRETMAGEYKIEANFYGSRQQELTGACTIQATIITNFGRPNEERKQITLRLTNAKEVVLVGKVKLD